MTKESDRYLYFTVGLLKDSTALETLWQDAMKYHMIDQPGKLIAMRLTEYYEIVAQGLLHPIANVSMTANPASGALPPTGDTGAEQKMADQQPASAETDSATDKMRKYRPDEEPIVTVAAEPDKNAEEAAAYWTIL